MEFITHGIKSFLFEFCFAKCRALSNVCMPTDVLKRLLVHCWILTGLSGAVPLSHCQTDDPGKAAEARAVEFLKREVPAWSKNNGCFSCHNNGDAARALYKASQNGYLIPADVLADTTAWLAKPQLWDKNKGEPGISDQRLANLQFAVALLTASETGYIDDKKLLAVVARKVAEDQDPSGAWQLDSSVNLGSPATYGSTLATALARRMLKAAEPGKHRKAIEGAEQWLRKTKVDSVLAAASLLLASNDPGPLANISQDRLLTMIDRAQTQDGGWGPYADSPPEVFDTAIVILALKAKGISKALAERIHRGRTFLAQQQDPDGGWPATTRPRGNESYAQRLSTTGWATLALLATSD